MTIRLTEVIGDELVTALAADLPAAVATYRALAPALAAADMPDVAEVTRGDRQIHTTLPAIELVPLRSPLVHDGFDVLTFRHRFVVWVFVEHHDDGTLQRLLERYAACVVQVLADRRAGLNGGLSFDLQFATEEGAELLWGPRLASERQLFQRDVSFEVIANADDSRT